MFLVEVDKVITKITQTEQMTSGSQNVYVVKFNFSEEWAFLKRTAVFRQGEKVVNILLDDENRCMIPWEVMQVPFAEVDVGVFGVKGDDVVLPTIWASMGEMLQGVITGEEPLDPPTPSVYEQLLSKWTTIEDQIKNGALTGPQGESAYDTAVKNGFEGTEEEWLASLQGEQGPIGPAGQDGKDGKDADLINRCIWFYEAGSDISIFANGLTNVASPSEFIGHTPMVSTGNVGLILVDSKLYWTKFDITEASENAVTQLFTQSPILIGPVSGGNTSESTLFVVNYNRAPTINDYFNITPDRMYGAIPKNGDVYTLIAFTTDGIFDCTCVVTDYTPGKWATQVKVTTVSGVNVYSKEQIDAMFEGIEVTDSLITIKDTNVDNISKVPVNKTPCCIHMVNSRFGFEFNDDIIYVKCAEPLVFVYTMDGMVAELSIGSNGKLSTNDFWEIKGEKGDPGTSAYEIAVDNGFEGTEEEWLASLHGPKGDDGQDGSDGFSPTVDVTVIEGGNRVTITDADGPKIFDVMNGSGGGSSADSISIPSGVIWPWYHTAEQAVPNGWALCDGTNNTPDLRGRFLLGSSESHLIGEIGGSENVTLTLNQIPSHAHGLPVRYSESGGSFYGIVNNGRGTSYANQTSNAGGSEPHTNMPPYFTIDYIIKL